MPRGDRPLLSAKLLVPPRSGAVARSRLLAGLRTARGARLTTVIAPAGWGKTTLLTDWAHDPSEHRRFAWFSIDEADDEPVRFWTYALTALQSVAPDLVGDALSAIRGPGVDPVGVSLAALLNRSVELTTRVVLVLDDYHAINDPVISENLEFLVSYLPDSLHLVVAARADPPLPLARLRARGQLTEIRAEELRFTQTEGAALVASVTGIPDAAVTGVVARTEGWAAGLHLAALAIRSAPDPAAVARSISGGHRYILDYFDTEVLNRLDPAEQRLLIHCSVLNRLSGTLCDAVLETSGSAAVLRRLERADLFVTALDEDWYRLHRMFRDVLARRLAADAPAARPGLLRRAADWFLSQGRVEEALEYRIEVGDDQEIVEFLRANGRWFLDHGAMGTLLFWSGRLTAAAGDPRLCLTLAFAAGLSGRPDDAVTWLRAAEPLLDSDPQPLPGWASLRAGWLTTWAGYGARKDLDEAVRCAREAVALENDQRYWGFVIARQALGAALSAVGLLSEAVPELRAAWSSPLRRQVPALLQLQCAGLLALDLVELGRLDAAHRVIVEIRDTAATAEREWATGAGPAVTWLRLAEARLAALSEPAASLPALRRAVELAQAWGWPASIVLALSGLAAAQWAAGDRSAARLSVDRAGEAARDEPPGSYAVRQLTHLQATIGHAAGAPRDEHRAVGAPPRGRQVLAEELTDREREVLRALRGPLSAREIGAELFLSINTVKTYTKSLYRKLGVATRDQAVTRGRELGLL